MTSPKPAPHKPCGNSLPNSPPLHDSGHYAQAMMDMGATLCTRAKPKCHLCPVANDCKAYQTGNPTAYPIKTKKPPKPTRHSHPLFISHDDDTLWLQRPDDGIWGGLWCVPIYTADNLEADTFDDKNITDWLHTHHVLPSNAPNASELGKDNELFEVSVMPNSRINIIRKTNADSTASKFDEGNMISKKGMRTTKTHLAKGAYWYYNTP